MPCLLFELKYCKISFQHTGAAIKNRKCGGTTQHDVESIIKLWLKNAGDAKRKIHT